MEDAFVIVTVMFQEERDSETVNKGKDSFYDKFVNKFDGMPTRSANRTMIKYIKFGILAAGIWREQLHDEIRVFNVFGAKIIVFGEDVISLQEDIWILCVMSGV